jgi:L-ascorbate metabolism protein UlaG (beta-lactamase superfamily)
MLRGTLFAAMLLAASAVHAEADFVVHPDVPGCTSLTPAAVGGPLPPPGILALRWFGTTNFELVWNGKIYLLDAYYDRGPRNRPIGFAAADVKHADAIFIGHAHFDHMADAVPVAQQTGAPLIGAPTVAEVAAKMGLPAGRMVTVRGGEVLQYPGFTVEAILARHSTLAPEVLSAFRSAIEVAGGAPTAEEKAAEDAILKRGTFDPRVITEGTIAYLFTFENGFTLAFRNSAGPATEAERAVMQRVGHTDVAIIGYIGQYLAKRQIAATLPLIQLYNPRLYLPAHHDEIAGTFIDIGLEPLFMALRGQMPATAHLAPLYREPVCLDLRRARGR